METFPKIVIAISIVCIAMLSGMVIREHQIPKVRISTNELVHIYMAGLHAGAFDAQSVAIEHIDSHRGKDGSDTITIDYTYLIPLEKADSLAAVKAFNK